MKLTTKTDVPSQPIAGKRVIVARREWVSEYHEEFITVDEELQLLRIIRGLPFRQESSRGHLLKRRQCDFVASYLVTGRLEQAEAFPDWLDWVALRVGIHCGVDFDQLIVTWYPPNAGIGAHIDSASFEEVIAGLSLGSRCLFRRVPRSGNPGGEYAEQYVEPRSLYVLRGSERWNWKHEIPRQSVKADRWSGVPHFS